ncbi:putative glycosyltransferase 3 [Hibiscus syriacus]|uniref:Glycosyltransferase 3 n=1 Tax=Hibiscus syriacus TaxID=106335 RepID=A0A6A3CL11_HIBSY|nr:putative glycosyltransferase 3 [Hibiscus syriacus]
MLRGRQFNKTFNHIKITFFCGFITILVLRGTIGIGGLGSSQVEANINQNLIEETNRIIADIRSDSDPDEPPETETDHNITFSLGPKVSNWDQQPQIWLSRNLGFPKFINGEARIMLVTGSAPNPCDNAIGDHLLAEGGKEQDRLLSASWDGNCL